MMDGWTASVCTQLDQQQTFLSWTHKSGKKTMTISKELCLFKVKEGKREEIDWALKQKLFDNIPESECAERQGQPYSLKWALKNKEEKVRARLVVREDKKAKSEDEELEPSDVFSAMPPLESLKTLDRTSRPTWTKFGACSVRRVKTTLLRCVCV